MQICTEDLCTAINQIADNLESNEAARMTLMVQYYFLVMRPFERHATSKVSDIGLGDVDDEWDSLRELLEEDRELFHPDLIKLGGLLKAIACHLSDAIPTACKCKPENIKKDMSISTQEFCGVLRSVGRKLKANQANGITLQPRYYHCVPTDMIFRLEAISDEIHFDVGDLKNDRSVLLDESDRREATHRKLFALGNFLVAVGHQLVGFTPDEIKNMSDWRP